MSGADEHFVGRASETAAFERLLSADSPPVLVFWGPPGVGKSTLLSHLSGQARGWRSHVLDLERMGLGSRDYAPSAENLLFGLARMLASPDRSTRPGIRGMREFERRAARAARDFLGGTRKIKVVQSASFGGDVRQSQVHVHGPWNLAEARMAYRRAVVVALADLVRLHDMSRSVLFVDTAELLRFFDATDSDHAGGWPGTLLGLAQWFLRELVPELLDAGPGLRIVLAGREKFSISEPWIRQVEVAEWASSETARYLTDRGFNDPEFANTVHLLCAGVPLWTAMLAEACIRQGVRGPEASPDWLRSTAQGRPAEHWLPEVVLARLPPSERDIVICAAVPRDLSLELTRRLLQTAGIDPPAGWWDNLCGYSFVRFAAGREPGGHRYMHRMARAAVLTHLDRQEPERLLALHRESADYYQRLSRFADEAYHRFACGDYGLVGRWQEKLYQARRQHDIGTLTGLLDAVNSPEQIIRIARHNRPLVVEVEYQQGLLEYTQDRSDEAIAHMTTALRGFQGIGDDQGESRSHRWIAIFKCYLGDYPAAVEAVGHALAAARRAGDARLLLEAHSVAGDVYGEQGISRYALSHYSAALRLARRAGHVTGESEALRAVAGVLFWMGLASDASRYLDLAQQAAEGSPDDVSMCHHLRGWFELQLGNPAGALVPLDQQLRMTRSFGNRRDIGWSLRPVATALILLGHHDDARQYIAEALQIFDELGDRSGQCLMHCLTALADLIAGHHQSAQAEAHTACLLSRGIPNSHIRGWAILVRSASSTMTGARQWQADLQESLTQFDHRSHSSLIAGELIMIADILILAGAHEAAPTYLQHALAYSRRSGHIDRQHEIRRRLTRLRERQPPDQR
jgi:tetratricopeptide (TPR) repeat protein